MEQEGSVAERRQSLSRLALKAGALAVPGALAALALKGGPAASGTFLGVVVAALYSWGYLRGHLKRAQAPRKGMVDPPLVLGAMGRFVLLAIVTALVYVVDRDAFLGYLIGFAVGFGVLVASEVPRVSRELRARGMLG